MKQAPAEWRRVRAKYLYRVIDERVGNETLPLLAVSIHRGVVPRESLTEDEPRADDLTSYKRCAAGDVVVNRMRAFQGAVGVAPRAGIVSPDYVVLRMVDGVDVRFFHHLFRSTWFVGEMTARLRGIGSSDQGNVRTPRINVEDFGEITLALPTLDEQRGIAALLDAETGRIDALIEKKRRMIAVSNEGFRAFLDSAFSLLAPRVRLGRFVILLVQGTSPQAEAREADEGEWGVLKLSAVRFGRYRPTENKALPVGYRAATALVPRSGDLLVTRSNTPEYVGDACAVPAEVPYRMLCDLIYLIRFDRRLDPRYAAYSLLTSDGRQQIESAARGSSQSMVKLRGEDVKAVEIPYIPLGDQSAIVDEIENRRSRADRLVQAVERQIDLLREHRKALITAAVTGQLEVVKAAA